MTEVLARFAADTVGRGEGLSAATAARSLGARPGAALDAAAWQGTLRGSSTADGHRMQDLGRGQLFRPEALAALSVMHYATEMVGPGTPVPGGAQSEDAAIPPAAAGGQRLAISPGVGAITAGGTRAARPALRCENTFGALNGTYDTTLHRRSEPFDPTEFREVLYLRMRDLDGLGGQACTGALIGARWVLTAAHCVMFRMQPDNRMLPLSTASVTGSVERDHDRTLTGNQRHEAVRHPDAQGNGRATFRVVRTIVPGAYEPRSFARDVALLELDEDAADGITAQPAGLGGIAEARGPTTVAGYGYSPQLPNDTGILNVGWPPAAIAANGFLQVNYTSVVTQDGATRICPGDSGGPMFAGLHRGCRIEGPPAARLRTEALRPRMIVGVNSNIHNVDPNGTIDGVECWTTTWNRMVDVTAEPLRSWICGKTANAVMGCGPAPAAVPSPIRPVSNRRG